MAQLPKHAGGSVGEQLKTIEGSRGVVALRALAVLSPTLFVGTVVHLSCIKDVIMHLDIGHAPASVRGSPL